MITFPNQIIKTMEKNLIDIRDKKNRFIPSDAAVILTQYLGSENSPMHGVGSRSRLTGSWLHRMSRDESHW